MKKILMAIKKSLPCKFISEIPEVRAAVILIVIVLGCLYIFDEPGGFINIQFPGLFLDIAVFGVLIVLFNKFAEKRRDIKRWQEEIDDYRGWKEPEAAYRIAGNIRRLNKYGISKIYLDGSFLEEADLSGADLRKSTLDDCDFQRAFLSSALLQKSRLFNADLKNAILINANFQGANLHLADLRKAKLFQTNMQNASLKCAHLEETTINADLSNADLRFSFLNRAVFINTNIENACFGGSDLRGVDGLSIDMASKAKSFFNAKLDPEFELELKEKYPHLLEMPKENEAGAQRVRPKIPAMRIDA